MVRRVNTTKLDLCFSIFSNLFNLYALIDSFVQLPQPNLSIPSTLPSTGSIQSLSSLMGKKLIPPSDSNTNDTELKKILKKKNQVIFFSVFIISYIINSFVMIGN